MTTMPQTLSMRVPLAIRRRGGRKTVIMPDGAPTSEAGPRLSRRADPTLVKALARSFRWKRLLETGQRASITEIAETEKIDRGYVGSMLRLTLLAPDLVEQILDGRQPIGLGLSDLLRPLPVEWAKQRAVLMSGSGVERPANDRIAVASAMTWD